MSRFLCILEVGGVEPKVSPTGKSSSEFDVFALSRFAYASRDVRGVLCVRRRARDSSMGRVQSEGPEILWRPSRFHGFVLLILLRVCPGPRVKIMYRRLGV